MRVGRGIAVELQQIMQHDLLSLETVKKITNEFPDFDSTVVVNVVVSGHSLGGALAVLNTLALLNTKKPLVNQLLLYTAACPPVLTPEARAILHNDDRLVPVHVCHHGDMIPIAPMPHMVHHSFPIVLGTTLAQWKDDNDRATIEPHLSWFSMWQSHSTKTYDAATQTLAGARMIELVTRQTHYGRLGKTAVHAKTGSVPKGEEIEFKARRDAVAMWDTERKEILQQALAQAAG